MPGEFHGQKLLAGYSPWVCTELDVTEPLTLANSRLVPFLPHPRIQLSAATRGKNCKLIKGNTVLSNAGVFMWSPPTPDMLVTDTE